ncbi:MAG: hypothetical protein ABR548_00635 [Actinomycetota bacterium]
MLWVGLAYLLLSMGTAHAVTVGVVIARGMSYIPGNLDLAGNQMTARVPRGSDVLFTNLDQFSDHSMTSDGGWFDSGPTRFREQVTLPTSALAPGSYGFFCLIHGNMIGTLVVV